MKRIFFYVPILILCIGLGYEILSIWRAVYLFKDRPSEEILLKTLKLTPSNPDPFYGLGLLYQWDIRSIDLKKSSTYFCLAIERNPLEQIYWINLAKVLQRIGEGEAFERALDNAVYLFPTGFRGRWVTGTLLLQQGLLEKARPHFSYLLSHYPEQSHLVYDVWSKVVDDPESMLETLVPRSPASLSQYLSYLYETADSQSVKRVWERMNTLGYRMDQRDTLGHIEFLISHGELREAFEIWKSRLQQEGLSIPADGSLITNGGFEKEKMLGGGFDWKIGSAPGAGVSFDLSVALEGRRSLRITFDGKENIDFHHISQVVPLKPDTDYLLRAYMKTKALTTKSGPKVEVYGIGPNFYGSSESLTGDNEWKELSIAFRTPAQSLGGVVRVRREKTDKFNRFISGTAWIDNVRLTEVTK
jgi:hypothetical protein